MKQRLTSHLFFIQQQLQIPEENMLSAIDEVIWLLKDGEWHNLEEITEKTSFPIHKVKVAVSFLQEYNFIQVRGEGEKAKLCPMMLNFVNQIQSAKMQEALSH